MKRIITLSIVFLLVTGKLFSQGKIDYDTDSKWFWGINAGVTWQTTDVANKNAFGYGLTFGRAFNYDYGKRLSFDIRARYLRGHWYGQDLDSMSLGADYDGVYSQFDTDYKDSLGYVVNNFETDVHRLALELVLHANGIRERTGWDPYIFGGVGLTWYQTKGNLQQNNLGGSEIYDYNSLSAFNTSTIEGLLDDTYETPLEGSGPILHNVAYMPSLGFGLGYQISKRVSIGIEHKTTFTRTDSFDGLSYAGTYKQDFHHYTSGYIRFQIRGGYTEETTHTTETVQQTPVGPTQPPVVTYVNPSAPGTTVSSPNYTVVAEVKYVNGWNDIGFKHDGVANNNFTYNPSTQRIESNVVLHPGTNTFETKGTNSVGSDVEVTTIIYQREAGIPPVVTITNPATTPVTVSNPVFNFTATVLNVQQQSQVLMTVNNQNYSNFTFNPTSTVLTSGLNLVTGTNVVTVKGTNTFGTDSKTVTIIYQPIVQTPVQNPSVVTFTNPSVDPFNTTASTHNVKATVTNVAAASGITVNLNGTPVTNFTFNPTTTIVAFTANLIEGTNVVTITGTNTAGTDSEPQTIIYTKPQILVPPVVTFTNPSVDPYNTTVATHNVTATVTNVTAASGVSVNMNGTLVTNFNFNPTTKVTAFTTNLIEGTNIITITGTNTAGTDSEQQTIIYRKPQTVVPPVVTYTNPSVDPFTTTTQAHTITATVTNVSAASGVSVNLNGSAITNFTFNPATTVVSFPVTLIEGANIMNITGTNTAGTDSEQQTINYTKPQVIEPPVVTYINPAVDPYNTASATHNVSATVANVALASGITISLNNAPLTNFTFNSATHTVVFPAALIEGANVVIITGTNAAGTDSENQLIIYTKPQTIVPPVVTYINPSSENTNVTTPEFTLVATVLNVENSSQIAVMKGGQPLNASQFSYNAATKKVTFNVTLIPGTNTFTVKGTNTAGSDSKTVNITYRIQQAPCEAPIIAMVNPVASNVVMEVNNFDFKAIVTNATSLNQIHFTFNGQVVTGGTLDAATKLFTKTVVLSNGNNTFDLQVTNDCGTAKDNRAITFKLSCIPPTIQPVKPSQKQTQTDQLSVPVMANIGNVASKNQIVVTLNNLDIPFDYNLTSHVLSCNPTLAEGVNNVMISIRTECGSADYTWTITKNTCKVPTVTIKSSSVPNNTTTKNASFSLAAQLTEITSDNQITITRNGTAVNFVYNAETHEVNFVQHLTPGINKFMISAKNDCGSDVKSFVVTYSSIVTSSDVNMDAPHIILTCPGSANSGTQVVVSGTVVKVAEAGNVSIKVNGQPLTSFNPTFAEGVMSFHFSIDVSSKIGTYTIEVTATNTFGTDTKSCTFKVAANGNPVGPSNRQQIGGTNNSSGTTTTPAKPGSTTVKPTGTSTPVKPAEDPKPTTPTPVTPPSGRGGK